LYKTKKTKKKQNKTKSMDRMEERNIMLFRHHRIFNSGASPDHQLFAVSTRLCQP
jgi:hypothetical protein